MAPRKTTKLKSSIKAFGRSLSDFLKLSKAELKLIEACRTGQIAMYGDGTRPEVPTIENTIRPELIRFLAMGGDEFTPVHEMGLWIKGAWIPSHIDLECCQNVKPLSLDGCFIDGEIIIRDARLRRLNLTDSYVHKISGDRCKIIGGITLKGNFLAKRGVRILGAEIYGDLSCSGGTFHNEEDYALVADGAKISGSVFLNTGFEAIGEVRLLSCAIGRSLMCTGGKFSNDGGSALSAEGAKISGDVFLDKGFHATGEVRFLASQIGGNLACRDGKFISEKRNALNIDGAIINGVLFLDGEFSAVCPVRFTSTRARAIIDRVSAIPQDSVLDGFTYGQVLGGVATDAATRIAWLNKQPADHLGVNFKPQPWEQLIKVLREMGHKSDADEIAIEKQNALFRAGKIQGINRIWHLLYKYLAGYGYRPLNTLIAMSFVCLFAACNFHYASLRGLIGPTSSIIQTDSKIASACNVPTNETLSSAARETQWTRCAELPQTYTTFNPYLYSLDLILPLVNLQQEDDWSPIVTEPDSVTSIPLGAYFRFVMWFEILFGWMASLLLVAVLGNLVKKD